MTVSKREREKGVKEARKQGSIHGGYLLSYFFLLFTVNSLYTHTQRPGEENCFGRAEEGLNSRRYATTNEDLVSESDM